MDYNVKGSSIRSKLDFVEERFGPEAREAISQTVRSEDLDRILDSSWYPYATYVEVLRVIVERYFDGEEAGLQEVGRFSAHQALSTTYRAFRTTETYTAFLGRISSLHHMLYSVGRSQIEIGEGGNSCAIVLTGKPTLATEDLQVALGFYLGCGLEYGHRAIRGDFELTGGEARFRLDW